MKTALALVLLLAPATAFAQIETREGIALQNQILELRQELQQVQAQGGGGGPPPAQAPYPQGGPPPSGDLSAQLLVRVSALEEQVRDLQGKVDDLTNQLQRQNDTFSKQLGDLSFKLGQGGNAGGGAGGGAGGSPGGAAPGFGDASPDAGPPSAGRPPPPPEPAHRTPEQALKLGHAAFARHDYTAAASSAREAIAAHSPRSLDAQFLLASAEGAQGDHKQAAADYYDAYNKSPRSPRAPEALLGVATSLAALGDKHDSCEALAKLRGEFPGMRGDLKARVADARRRASCGG